MLLVVLEVSADPRKQSASCSPRKKNCRLRNRSKPGNLRVEKLPTRLKTPTKLRSGITTDEIKEEDEAEEALDITTTQKTMIDIKMTEESPAVNLTESPPIVNISVTNTTNNSTDSRKKKYTKSELKKLDFRKIDLEKSPYIVDSLRSQLFYKQSIPKKPLGYGAQGKLVYADYRPRPFRINGSRRPPLTIIPYKVFKEKKKGNLPAEHRKSKTKSFAIN